MALKGPDFHQLPHPVEKILKVVGMLLLVNKLMSMSVPSFIICGLFFQLPGVSGHEGTRFPSVASSS